MNIRTEIRTDIHTTNIPIMNIRTKDIAVAAEMSMTRKKKVAAVFCTTTGK